jgi:hypothetical protein
MFDHKLVALAASLRARAKVVLAQAEMMDDAEARLMMREVAASHEGLATRVEELSFEAPPPQCAHSQRPIGRGVPGLATTLKARRRRAAEGSPGGASRRP